MDSAEWCCRAGRVQAETHHLGPTHMSTLNTVHTVLTRTVHLSVILCIASRAEAVGPRGRRGNRSRPAKYGASLRRTDVRRMFRMNEAMRDVRTDVHRRMRSNALPHAVRATHNAATPDVVKRKRLLTVSNWLTRPPLELPSFRRELLLTLRAANVNWISANALCELDVILVEFAMWCARLSSAVPNPDTCTWRMLDRRHDD